MTQTWTELSYPGQVLGAVKLSFPFPVVSCVVVHHSTSVQPQPLQGGWEKIALNYFTEGYWNSVHKVPKLRLYKQTYNNSSMSPIWSAWSTTICMYSNNWVSFLEEFCLEIHVHHQHSQLLFLAASVLRYVGLKI